jgi:hypothetical protein
MVCPVSIVWPAQWFLRHPAAKGVVSAVCSPMVAQGICSMSFIKIRL